MIHSTLRVKLPAGKLREVLGILAPMAERVRVDPACLGCHVYQDAQDDRVLMLEERWRSEQDLQRRLRSSAYQTVLLLMEMAVEEPEVTFDAILQSTGLKTIADARGPASESAA
jgi:quinol monooxygenase YgiN